MSERFERRMNTSDTTLWRIERDPSLRTTILAVTMLGRAPGWGRLRDRIEAVTREIPRLRQKVAEPPFGMGAPRWVPDPSFDLEYHLRRVVAPAPGDMRSVLDLATPTVMTAFDRERPLWEFTLVEGLADGRAAMLQKVHHSVTDGVGAVRLARLLFDPPGGAKPGAAGSAALPAGAEADGPASAFDVMLGSVADQVRDATAFTGRVALALPRAVDAGLRDPVAAATGVARAAESIVKLVRPVSEPFSPVLRGRGWSRRLAVLELSLRELKAAAHAGGGTVNDAFLAALAGGMRRYHEIHGADVERLRVTMPINMRTGDDAGASNRFTPVRFALPIGTVDPIARIAEVGAIARSMRREPGLRFTGAIAGTLNALPEAMTTAVLGAMLKGVDLVATNVPGLDRPARLSGAPVERVYAFAPPSGAAFSAALLSHLDACSLGLTMDAVAVADPDVLAACVSEGFEEVLALAGT